MYKWCLLLLILAFFMTSTLSYSEDQAESARLYKDVIAGPEGRAWILEAVGRRLGADSECTQGKSWVFFSDGLLVKRSCVEGQMVENKHRWSIEAADAGRVKLTIDTVAHWIEIMTDRIAEPGLPPSEELIAKIQEVRDVQENQVRMYELKRTKGE